MSRVDEIASATLSRTDDLLDRKAADRLLSVIRNDLQRWNRFHSVDDLASNSSTRYPVVERAMAYLAEDVMGNEQLVQSLLSDLENIQASLLLPVATTSDPTRPHAPETLPEDRHD